MVVWLISAVLAAEPGVYITWKGDETSLRVHAPEGEHVAPDAPADLTVRLNQRTLSFSGMGEDLLPGVAIGAVRGRRVEASMSLSLCEDKGTRCRIVAARLEGDVPDVRRGSLALSVSGAEHAEGFPARADADSVWESAVAEARRSGRPILLDFGAVWCPPCNLLSAELLHAEPTPDIVERFVVAELDVDDASSWPLKDRYGVGGYPTLVVVDADGAELGRTVGYRGVDATSLWMEGVLNGAMRAPEGAPSPRQAADLAWAAVRTQRFEEGEHYLEIAASEPELVSFRLARFGMEPTPEDARWLAERAPDAAMDWVPRAMRISEQAGVREAIESAIDHALLDASTMEAADLLQFRAELASDEAAPALFAASAALVRSMMDGDPGHDKGLYGWLAYLTEHAGDRAAALGILEAARDAFPEEPTFHTSLSRMYLRGEMAEEALAEADRAMEMSWGDNRLTAATVRTKALLALGREVEAREFVVGVLEALPVPAEGVDVRTHRMRGALESLVRVE